MCSERVYRFIAALVITALCVLWMPGQSVFGIERPDAADAGLDAGPQITAKGAVVYCENTGDIVYSKESREEYAPYTLVQLVTALVVLQETPLDKQVKISAEVAEKEGATLMNLQKGEKLPVEELLYGMLMTSSSDAAYALAECISGDKTSKFVKKMNKLARNLGCEDTKFADPAGLKKKNRTTARDFLRILRVALNNETINKISGTTEHVVPRTNKSDSRTLHSTVPLLNVDDAGIYAGKGSITRDNRAMAAVGYEQNGLRLYVVLLEDTVQMLTEDIESLTTYARTNVQGIKVVEEGKAMGKVRVRHGAVTSISAITAKDGFAYLPKEGSAELIRHSVKMKAVTAPVSKGQVVGYYTIRVGNTVTNRVPLIAGQEVAVGWPPSYIGISNRVTMIILIVLGVILLFLLWVIIVRLRQKRRRARLRKEEIRQMARQKYLEEEDRRKRDWDF